MAQINLEEIIANHYGVTNLNTLEETVSENTTLESLKTLIKNVAQEVLLLAADKAEISYQQITVELPLMAVINKESITNTINEIE